MDPNGFRNCSGKTVCDDMFLARDVLDLNTVLLNVESPIGDTGPVGMLASHEPLEALMVSANNGTAAQNIGSPLSDSFGETHTFLVPNRISALSRVEPP
jgi:hypothetical protein